MVRLVVLNFNGGDEVLECVASLERLDWPSERREVVVVDNASSDGSLERIAERHPGVAIVRNPENTGFSANNLALEELDGIDFVGLVNPDAWVDPGWLRALVAAFADRPTMGAACPRILLAEQFVDVSVDLELPATVVDVTIDGQSRLPACGRAWRLLGSGPRPDDAGRWILDQPSVPVPVPRDGDVGAIHLSTGPGTQVAGVPSAPYDVVNNTGVVLHDDLYASDRGLGQRADAHHPPEEVEAWTGGGVLLRAEFLRDVGVLDDVFFLYYEDVDLSWRGRRRGWSYRYVADARMWHHHAASSTEGSDFFRFHNERSRLLMIARNADGTTVVRSFARFALSTLGYVRADVLRPLLRRRRPDTTVVRTRVRALASATAALPRAIRGRD